MDGGWTELGRRVDGARTELGRSGRELDGMDGEWTEGGRRSRRVDGGWAEWTELKRSPNAVLRHPPRSETRTGSHARPCAEAKRRGLQEHLLHLQIYKPVRNGYYE